MSYSKNVWTSQDLITATKLNNIEDGIEAISTITDLVPIPNGGTGANNASDARTNLNVYSKTEAVAAADIVNNLTTTAAGKVLDARQGKVLSDAIAALGATMSSVASGNSTYISAVSGGYVKFGRLVIFSISYTMKAAITSSAANAVAGLPVPVGPARFLEFDKDGTTATSSATFCNLTTSGTINLRGAHAQDDTYYVSGAYISAS